MFSIWLFSNIPANLQLLIPSFDVSSRDFTNPYLPYLDSAKDGTGAVTFLTFEHVCFYFACAKLLI